MTADNRISGKDKRYAFVYDVLNERRSTKQFRKLRDVVPLPGGRIDVDGEIFDNFSSNDYLGLSFHQELQARAQSFVEKQGTGLASSRLVCGNSSSYGQIEKKLARLKGTESALIFNSGFQANLSLLPALTNRRSLILADKLCHNSLLQGGMLSRGSFMRYRHNDIDHLEKLLSQYAASYDRICVVTESIFSMDGDRADVQALAHIAQKYDALLYVDEAHATGVFGTNGMGLTVGTPVDIAMGTFGKGLGSFGAYICCSQALKEYCINFCSGMIYSTALPPAVLGAIDAALDIVPTMEEERIALQKKSTLVREALQQMGFRTGPSSSQIIPVLLGGEEEAIQLSRRLYDNKLFALAIRPPTVQQGTSRIRLTLTASHTDEQIERLIHVLRNWQK